jgi:hypothetical protein
MLPVAEPWKSDCQTEPSFADMEADRERPGGRKSPRRLGREGVHHRAIHGRSAAHPVRLRSSMSWAIQVFSAGRFPTTPALFSS